MRTPYLLALVFIVLGISFLYGTVIAEQCVTIDQYKGCWKTIDTSVKSELCPTNEPCIAKPPDQQNNAIVDVLVQACQKAKNSNYADASMNKRIEEVAKTFTRYDIGVNTLCDQPGLILVKRRYG